AAVLDESSARDGTHEHAFRIQKLDLFSSVRGGTGFVDLARSFHSEGFMRPAVVEVRLPQVARTLLVFVGGRSDRLDLERDVAVHALVSAVVRRRALARAKMVDAEAQPPGRQPGQAESATWRYERSPVVGEDSLGDAVELEQPLEELQRLLQPRRAADVHREDEAA